MILIITAFEILAGDKKRFNMMQFARDTKDGRLAKINNYI
jgi:hypothetical protein